MAQTTITDKRKFQAQIVDKKSFNSLSNTEKKLFEVLRNSILEILPTEKNNGETYPEICFKIAENFAFINLKAYETVTTEISKLEKELEKLKNQVQNLNTNQNVNLP
jgi:hypothetical protein